MKLSLIICATIAAMVQAAPAVPAEFLKAIEEGTAGPACTPVCYPAGGTTQCYCF